MEKMTDVSTYMSLSSLSNKQIVYIKSRRTPCMIVPAPLGTLASPGQVTGRTGRTSGYRYLQSFSEPITKKIHQCLISVLLVVLQSVLAAHQLLSNELWRPWYLYLWVFDLHRGVTIPNKIKKVLNFPIHFGMSILDEITSIASNEQVREFGLNIMFKQDLVFSVKLQL